MTTMALTRRMRWVLGGVGFLLPMLWLVATVQLFAWFPLFRGSATAFLVVVVLGFLAVGIATLGAPLRWGRRLTLIVVCWLLLLVQVAAILGWAFFSMDFGTAQRKFRASAAWMKPMESAWSRQSPGKDYSIAVASEPRRLTEDSLRFELRRGEFYADLFGKTSHRSEVNARDFPSIGETRWYAFSLFLPRDFPLEDNRLVLAQWHGADKKYFGEPSRSPSLAFRYSGGRFFITLRHSAERIVRDPAAVPLVTLFETGTFGLGEWHDFVVQATWSHREDGRVEVWWNDHHIVRYAGPVGYNDDFGPYFKFGLYRDETNATYVAYFSEVRVGNRNHVLPNKITGPNAGGPRQFPIRTSEAARVGQLFRSAEQAALVTGELPQ